MNKDTDKIRADIESITSIEDLRTYFEKLCTNTKEYLYGLWSLSKNFKDDDFETVKKQIHSLISTKYDQIKNIQDGFALQGFMPNTEKIFGKTAMYTYIFPISIYDKLKMIYGPYDAFIKYCCNNKMIKKEEFYEKLNNTPNNSNDIIDKDICLVRLIEGDQNTSDWRHQPTIQVYPINLLENVKPSMLMPWGPYDLVSICFRYTEDKLNTISNKDFFKIAEDFINKYNIEKL